MRIILLALLIFLIGCISHTYIVEPEYCPVCGAKLFHAIPKVTTQEDIIEFAENSNLDEEVKKQIIKDAWIHPGVYCPNGCYEELISYEY